MELADIRDWVKTLSVGDHFYIGKVESKKERSVGVYQRQISGSLISLWEVWNAQRQPASRSVY